MTENWALSTLLSVFDLTHALSCQEGGFVSLEAQYIRNTTASLLTDIYKDVRVKLLLQQKTGESLQHHKTRGSEVRLDV